MNTPKVSIIMPIYNAEEYLSNCINSILSQTFSEWELLLINDGSTDNSAEICDYYAAQDNRIKFIQKENEGVSAARQNGVDYAKGIYLIHVDSDDWIENNMLEEMYGKAEKEKADLVICDFFINEDNNQIYVSQKPSSLKPTNVLREMFQHLHGSCCNKLVRRDCYNMYNVSFPLGMNYCEDLITWVQLLQNDNLRIAYIDSAYYHYISRKSSITHNYTKKTFEMRQDFLKLLVQYLPDKGFEHAIRKQRLLVLSEGCMNDILTSNEAKVMARDNIKAIFLDNRNVKWLIGYIFILVGCYSIGRKFIKY